MAAKKTDDQKNDQKTDSEVHNEERRAAMAAEAKTKAEEQEIADFKGPVVDGETRDQLLDRIRAMRAEAEQKPAVEMPPLSERQKKRLELEQQAGAKTVKRHEEMDRAARALRGNAATVDETDGGKK